MAKTDVRTAMADAMSIRGRLTAPEIHIYPFSRLIHAPAARWEKLLKALEEKENIVYLYYQPAREAIVKLTASSGKRRDSIFVEMQARAAAVVHSPSQNPVRDNTKCFETFEETFLPKISSFVQSLIRRKHFGTSFGGVILKGLPHMEVIDQKGKSRLVYLYPSNWSDKELDAYLELLTIIIEAEFEAEASDLWCMDLRRKQTVKRSKSKVRTRKACNDAAQHFVRLRSLAEVD